jgi:3',5'-cyclic AMP phosphodiesterase CpdA
MTVVLQISDPHFGTERAPVVEALVAFARSQRPDLVVLSGDITQRARRREFAAARAFVNRLGAPLLAIPGNHDIPLFNLPARLLRPYAAQRAAFGHELEPVFSAPGLLVVGVNTTRPWRHENGAVGQAQIERVALRLAMAKADDLRIVVVHQPAEVFRPQDVHDRLRGHARALARWAEAGADLVMGGHIHLPYVMRIDHLARPLWVVQAGTSVSARVREGVPNSVNLVRWEGRSAEGGSPRGEGVVEQWDCPAAGPAFERCTVTPFTAFAPLAPVGPHGR